jgi:hypothetical protein
VLPPARSKREALTVNGSRSTASDAVLIFRTQKSACSRLTQDRSDGARLPANR